MRSRYYAVCVASSVVWAAIAYAIGHQEMPRNIIWGGVLASPLIGLAAGAIYRRAYEKSGTARVAMSLLTLYVAAALFGLAVGLFDVIQGLPEGTARITSAVMYQGVGATLFGLTFTGYVVILLPLAHLNHRLVGRLVGLPHTVVPNG